MSKQAIQECVALAGSQKALVAKMKVALRKSGQRKLAKSLRQGHISNWLCRPRKSEVPPIEYVPAMSAAVEHQKSPRDIRPDLADIYLESREGSDQSGVGS